MYVRTYVQICERNTLLSKDLSKEAEALQNLDNKIKGSIAEMNPLTTFHESDLSCISFQTEQ